MCFCFGRLRRPVATPSSSTQTQTFTKNIDNNDSDEDEKMPVIQPIPSPTQLKKRRRRRTPSDTSKAKPCPSLCILRPIVFPKQVLAIKSPNSSDSKLNLKKFPAQVDYMDDALWQKLVWLIADVPDDSISSRIKAKAALHTSDSYFSTRVVHLVNVQTGTLVFVNDSASVLAGPRLGADERSQWILTSEWTDEGEQAWRLETVVKQDFYLELGPDSRTLRVAAELDSETQLWRFDEIDYKIPVSPKMNAHNWMGQVYDHAMLNEINIPGTHQSCSLRKAAMGLVDNPRCQTQGLYLQLLNGLRSFDLRIDYRPNPGDSADVGCLYSCHGISEQEYCMTAILASIHHFLTQNPSETLILGFRREHNSTRWQATPERFFDTLRSEFAPYQDDYINPGVPSFATPLEVMRGKAIFLNDTRWSSTHLGFPENMMHYREFWPITHNEGTYNLPRSQFETKWTLIVKALELSANRANLKGKATVGIDEDPPAAQDALKNLPLRVANPESDCPEAGGNRSDDPDEIDGRWTFFQTWTNMSKLPSFDPVDFAGFVNPRLIQYIEGLEKLYVLDDVQGKGTGEKGRHLGMLSMDFPEQRAVNAIVRLNVHMER